MNKSLTEAIIGLLAVIGLSGCKHGQKDAAGEAPDIDVAEAFTDSLTLYKTYPGTLVSNATVNVVARVSGTILSAPFTAGDHVSRGQVLFTIDPTPYRDAVSHAEAALASARSAHDYARRQYAAMQQALLSDAVSQMEVARAKDSVEESAASIKQAEAALNTARTNLSYCTVTAPIAGRISSRTTDPGAYVDGAAQPVELATIYDNSFVSAEFHIEESTFMNLFDSPGSRTRMDHAEVPLQFTDSLPHSYLAHIDYTAPSVDVSTGTVEVKVKVANPYGELRNGMYATVRLPYRTDPAAVLVKEAAISTDQLGKFLYTVNDSNRVVYTPVTVGDLYRDTLRIITKGIAPGTRYVTRALLKVRPDMTINPVLTK